MSKNTLVEFAWPNVFVDEANLKVHVSSLRRALEDTLPQATYIATVAGRGYQFVGQVQTEGVEVAGLKCDDQPVVCSLPSPSTLIGRKRDVEGLARALDFARLVTLVGPGGVGKTSLAVAVAHMKHHKFPEGVHFVDLSATNDVALVPHLVATCLGVRGDPADLISAVVQHLQFRRMLIVLDNCEHVLQAAATILVRLVEAKIESCLLATSREPLGVCGENLQRVEPLAIPPRAKVRSASEAMLYHSVELFALRAFEAADYRLIDSDAQDIASLCEALDGLPLAIEIAAAKLDQFSPAELLSSLSLRLSELRNGNSTHSRHQTLWATLDWSYHLLSMQESTIFRLLSVFAGSFEWTDVAGMARLVDYDPYQITVALGGLVAKSLLSAELDGEQLRYRLLECTRSYAAERLLQDPLAQEAQRQHAQIVLSVFEKSEAEWAWVENHVWHARYEARTGDLRKALDWCFCDGGDASLGVDLAVSAIRLWNEQSSILEQLSQVERALNYCASVTDAPLQKAKLATSRAWSMTLSRQLHGGTDDAWHIALGFAELSGNVGIHLSVMFGQAVYLIYTGRNEQAVTLLDDFNRVAARAGDRASLFDGERLRALAEMHLGKLVEVRIRLERLAEEFAQGLPPSRIARYQDERYVSIHSTLAFSTWLTCRPERALAMAEEMVLKTGQIGQLMGQSNVLSLVALPLALWSGKIEALEKYSTMLRSNLDSENIAIWEPVHRFYDSVSRHARGSLNAIEDMRSAIDELVRDGFLVRTPMYLGVLAEALLLRGKPAEAYDAVESALTLQHQSKEIWCLPELLRVKARTMALLGDWDLASVMVERAREIAVTIGARSLELRIVNDMAQVAMAEGNNAHAVELLEPLYESFGVGAITEDLKRSALLLTTAGANRNPMPPQI